MSYDTIKCPQCGADIPVTEALSAQITEKLQQEIESKYKTREDTLAESNKALEKREKALAELAASVDEQVKEKTGEEVKRISAEMQKKAEEAVALKMQDLRNENDENKKKMKEAADTELTLRKKNRELVQSKEELQLEYERKLDGKRDSIRKEAAKSVTEQYELKIAEYEHKMKGMSDQIDSLKQKSEQGSQQTQGEVFELQLEELLQNRFPDDQIEPVAKGVRGADVIQYITSPNGRSCGSIIWETKRTKNWSDGWIDKLKSDQRDARADVAIIVSMALPKDVQSFVCINGVWVTDFSTLLPIAVSLRHGLIVLAESKQSEVGKNQKMEMMYNYLSGSEFKGRVEAIVETFTTMKRDLDFEKRAITKLWAQREKQIETVTENTAGMYGDLQGIIGASLPELDRLEIKALPESRGE